MLRLEKAEHNRFNAYFSNTRHRCSVRVGYYLLACTTLLASSYSPAAVAANEYQLPSENISSLSFVPANNKVKARLLNYSMVCIENAAAVSDGSGSQNAVINYSGSNRQIIPGELTESDLKSILLDIENNSFARDLDPVNVLTLHPLDIYQQDKPEKNLHGGSALGAVLRMSVKSWWKHNQGSQLHALSSHAPSTIRNGGFSGRAKYDWDYKLKLSTDDVKFKLEKVF